MLLGFARGMGWKIEKLRTDESFCIDREGMLVGIVCIKMEVWKIEVVDYWILNESETVVLLFVLNLIEFFNFHK